MTITTFTFRFSQFVKNLKLFFYSIITKIKKNCDLGIFKKNLVFLLHKMIHFRA